MSSSLQIDAVKHRRQSVSQLMTHVLVALLPGLLVYVLIIDARLLSNLLIAIVAAVAFEASMLACRKRPVISTLKDGSIVVAAALLVLSLPQSLPIWQLIFGIFIMCSLGKHVFGGLGHNPFNPAMVAYAVLIISFPQTMTRWRTDHGLLDSAQDEWDGVSSATPLERLDTQWLNHVPETLNTQLIDHSFASSIVFDSNWTLLTIAWLIGGLYLLFTQVINWRIPVAVLVSLWGSYLAYGNLASGPVLSPTIALFTGAIMFGAFFIATDPVSSAASNPGKWLYGCGIGILCFFIREFSHFPEGFAFAVLLMNMCVPLIDHAFTRNTLRANRRDT